MDDSQIVFTVVDDSGQDVYYKTGIWPDDTLGDRLRAAGVTFSAEIPTQTSRL